MESNISGPDLVEPGAGLLEPHFDEEATVLSARPVVPLEEIKSQTTFRHRWILGLAVAGALLLGVTASAFYFSRQNSNAFAGLLESDKIGGDASGLTTDLGLSGSTQASSQSTSVPETRSITRTEVAPEMPLSDSAPKASRKPVAKLVDVLTPRSERYIEERIREERKGARYEEKQRRRQARREMREDKSGDDLTRIREIFEGRRKP